MRRLLTLFTADIRTNKVNSVNITHVDKITMQFEKETSIRKLWYRLLLNITCLL